MIPSSYNGYYSLCSRWKIQGITYFKNLLKNALMSNGVSLSSNLGYENVEPSHNHLDFTPHIWIESQTEWMQKQ